MTLKYKLRKEKNLNPLKLYNYEVLRNMVNDTLEQSSSSLRGTGSYTIYLLEPDTLYIVRVRAGSEYASTESLPIIIFTGNISSLQLYTSNANQ